MALPDFIATLLASGFIGLALIALTEKLIPVVPSYVLLVFLGMTTVADARDLVLTVIATTSGSTLGGLCWYCLGRAIGARRSAALVARFGRYVFLSESLYERMTNAYRRNHFWVTLVGQTIPTVRIYLSLPAGVLKLAPRGFFVATILGTLAWNGPFLSLGYVLRNSGYEPLSIGLMVLAGLILMEVTLLFTFRALMRPARGNEAATPAREPAP